MRCLKAVRELSQAFALAVPHLETVRIRDDVSLFQHVRPALSKQTGPSPKSDEELDHAVRQIVSRAVASDGVVDIFAAAGLKKPDVSILSEEFLHEVRGMGRRNLAVELLVCRAGSSWRATFREPWAGPSERQPVAGTRTLRTAH